MTFPASGAISMSSIGTEMGGLTITNMNDTHIRQLAQLNVSSSTIAMSSLYSKTGSFTGNISMDSSTNSFAGIASKPFYNDTFVEVVRNAANGNAECHFNVGPTWTGDIVIKNNTTGISSQIQKVNAVNWSGSNPANLLRASTTDNFTIRPA